MVIGKKRKQDVEPEDKEDETEDNEPYWTAQQWEEWACNLMDSLGTKMMSPQDMLPDWFIEAYYNEE